MPDGTLTPAQLDNAINLVAVMAIDALAAERGIAPTEMLLAFMASSTAEFLYDAESRLWCDGPAAVVEDYKRFSGRSAAISSL